MKRQPDPPKFARVPPSAVPLEEVALGALMLDKEAIYIACDILKPETFYDPRHTKIYAAILALFNQQQPIDAMTVMETLRKSGELEAIGGPAYLASLTMKVASAANHESHCRIIQQYAIRREMISAAMVIEREGYDDSTDVFESLDRAQQEVLQISTDNNRGKIVEKPAIARRVLQDFDHLLNTPTGITGVTSGYAEIDQYTLGWQRGNLIVVGGRTGMGKTSITIEFAIRAAQAGRKVVFYSIGDMTAIEIGDSIIRKLAGIPFTKLQSRGLSKDDQLAMIRAAEEFVELPLLIEDYKSLGSANINAIRANARKKCDKGAELLVVDYLQKVWVDGFNLREERVGRVAEMLKEIAENLEVPVISPAQFNREASKRGQDSKPNLADFADSDRIGREANIAWGVWRPDYFGIEEDEKGNSLIGITEVIPLKSRSGGKVKKGTAIPLFWDANTDRLIDKKPKLYAPVDFSVPGYNATIPAPANGSGVHDDVPF